MFKFVLSILFLSLSSLYAIQLTMPIDELSPKGARSNINVFVENPDSENMKAVEVSVVGRRHTLDGVEERFDIEDEDLFFIYPQQMLVYPKEEKIVTVKYIGEPFKGIEKTYRLVVQEVSLQNDIENDDGGTRVKLLLKFVRSLYVDPGKTSSKLSIPEVLVEPSFVKEENITKNRLSVILENKGTKHQIIKSLEIEVSNDQGDKRTLTLSPSQIPMPNLLPNGRRKVVVDIPKGMSDTASYKARIIKLD